MKKDWTGLLAHILRAAASFLESPEESDSGHQLSTDVPTTQQTPLDQERRRDILNMLLKDYEIIRQEIRNCHSLYYKLALGFGAAGAGTFVYAAQKFLEKPDLAWAVVLGFFVPMLYVAQYALLMQYFFVYVILFVWRILAVETLLSRLSGIPYLMNFETEFARYYFGPKNSVGAKVNSSCGATNLENRPLSFPGTAKSALRSQMLVHYLIAIVAASPAFAGLWLLFYCDFQQKFPYLVRSAIVFFVAGLLFDFVWLARDKKRAERFAKDKYRYMTQGITFDTEGKEGWRISG